MAILIEGLSVVIRKTALDAIFPGGAVRFESGLADEIICSDHDLVCLHFRSPQEVHAFVTWCEQQEITFQLNSRCIDIVVLDQRHGPTAPCNWIEFCHTELDEVPGAKVALAWLFEDTRIAKGVHMKSLKMSVATPAGWRFAGSLSERHVFVPSGK